MISSLRRFIQTARWGKALLGLSLFVLAVTGFVPLAGCGKHREHKMRYHDEQREQYERDRGEKRDEREQGEKREKGEEEEKGGKQGEQEREGEEDKD